MNIYENNAVYNIKADINHEEEFYITNIDNTSDRQKIMSSLKIQVIDQINKCTVLNYNKTISQFYIFASSDQFISNKVAEKKIKENNTEILVRNLIPKLIKTKLFVLINNQINKIENFFKKYETKELILNTTGDDVIEFYVAVFLNYASKFNKRLIKDKQR